MITKEEKQLVIENLKTLPPNWKIARLGIGKETMTKEKAMKEIEEDTAVGKAITESYLDMLKKI